MTIDRPHPDILVFNPPPQSIKYFRIVHRSLTVGLMMILFVCILVFLFATIYCFNVLLRHEIFPIDTKLIAILLISFFGAFIAAYNAISIYLFLNFNKPILVQSCTFDRSCGKISIQQYNLFDRQPRTIEIPLSAIVDIQVRNDSVRLAGDFLSISLMTRQSSKPVYILQRNIPRQIPLPVMKALLAEVSIIRDFLHLPSEPPYQITDCLNWYELLFAVPAPTERIRSIDGDSNNLRYTIQSRRYGERKTCTFERTAATIKIERRALICKLSEHIIREDIQTIALKTEFLPLEYSHAKLISYWHIKQYQKQYSATLIPSDRARKKPKNGYWRIFTSNDLAIVKELADRIGAHLDLPVEEFQFDRAIELESAGAVK